MTTTPEIPTYWPPQPAGAVHIGEWEGDGADRGRHFEHSPVDIGGAILTIQGVQYASGTTGRSIRFQVDEALQNGGDDLTPLCARRLAAMLQNFADTCEILDGIER